MVVVLGLVVLFAHCTGIGDEAADTPHCMMYRAYAKLWYIYHALGIIVCPCAAFVFRFLPASPPPRQTLSYHYGKHHAGCELPGNGGHTVGRRASKLKQWSTMKASWIARNSTERLQSYDTGDSGSHRRTRVPVVCSRAKKTVR